MSLYTRLIGLTEPKLPVHQFMAALSENKRGQVTAQQVIAAFSLNAQEQTEVTAIIARFTANQLNREIFHDVLLLAEYGLAYTTEAALKNRLGV